MTQVKTELVYMWQTLNSKKVLGNVLFRKFLFSLEHL